MSRPNWSRGHMAAYIRPITVPVRGRVHRINATSPTESIFLSLGSYRSNSPKIHKKLMNPSSNSAPIQSNFTRKLQIRHWIQLTERNRSRIHTKFIQFQAVLRDSWESSSSNCWTCNSNASTPPEVARCKRDRRHWIREEEEEEVKDFTGSGSKEERKEWNRLTSKDPNQESKKRLQISEQKLR